VGIGSRGIHLEQISLIFSVSVINCQGDLTRADESFRLSGDIEISEEPKPAQEYDVFELFNHAQSDHGYAHGHGYAMAGCCAFAWEDDLNLN